MARYKTIDIRIWMDEKFLSLDEGTKLLFIYLLTSQHTTPIGTLSLPSHVIAAWLQNDIDTVSKRLGELSQKGLIKVSSLGLIWIRNYLKYNPPANPKVAVGYCKFFDEMPECALQGDVAKAVISSCKSRGKEYLDAVETKLQIYIQQPNKSDCIETVSEWYRNQEQEQKQEQEYINHNKQTTEIRYGETTGPDPVCLENSLSENIRDAQDNSCDESKFEDDDSLLTVLEVIKLCSYNRLKVSRSQRLVEVVNSGAVSVGMVKECIDITKASNGSGAYFVGCLANAIHEPERYLTTIQKIRRSAQKEKEAEQFLLEHGDEVF